MKLKGFVLGVLLALSLIRICTMSISIYQTVTLWQSLSVQERAEIKEIVSCLTK